MPRLTRHATCPRRLRNAFVGFASFVFLLTSPGRIVFPDDEIVFQTTRALWERGDLAVDGIPKRTGEPKGRPDGTFGWAYGRGGNRYGFFGHGLSLVALPAYALGKIAARYAPPHWRHAIRSDHFFVHPRGREEDWTRLVVSWINVPVSALASWALVRWLLTLRFGLTSALGCGLLYAFGTATWSYSRTFLSEPLSALVMLAAATSVARFRDPNAGPREGTRALVWAAFLVGCSLHVHILNVVAIPSFLLYAAWTRSGGSAPRSETRRAWTLALLAGAAPIALLLFGQWFRFGSALETGRFGLYSHFVVPGEGLAAMIISPGRSLFIYAPPLLLALFGLRRAWSRAPAATAFALTLIATRLLFVATRSDWWGGWSLGPRYLIPVLPFGFVGLAAWFERSRSRSSVLAICASSVGFVLLHGHLAVHSIFEWMMRLRHTYPDGREYLTQSHWALSAMPSVGFRQLQPDVLSLGAFRLAHLGHSGFSWVFAGIGSLALVSAILLVRAWRQLHAAQRAADAPAEVGETPK